MYKFWFTKVNVHNLNDAIKILTPSYFFLRQPSPQTQEVPKAVLVDSVGNLPQPKGICLLSLENLAFILKCFEIIT